MGMSDDAEETSLYAENGGIFGHVPTPEEAAAKAFVMPRGAQPVGFWPGYVSGLLDAGVPAGRAMPLLGAFCRGEFEHNLEPSFDDELGDEDEDWREEE